MAEQAVWRVKRIILPIPVPSLSGVRSRLWMVGPPLLLGLVAALLAMQAQDARFRAKAEVSANMLGAEPAYYYGTNGQLLAGQDPSRFMTGQASVARSPEVARRVVAAADVPRITAAWFLRHSSAKPQPNTSILDLSVSHPKAAVAVRLSNSYASQFVRFKTERDLSGINRAIRAIKLRIESLRDSGMTDSPVYGTLVQQRLDLKTMGALLSHSASVLQQADSATKMRPHALRNGILGGVIGALLGVGLVVAVAGRRPRRMG
jgi:uncharacterized protein involved in exopolysaccharide biosynthesis